MKVTDASVRECVLYANLALRGEDTNQIGTALTVEISEAFDAWKAEIRSEAWAEGLSAGADRWMDAREFGEPPVNPYVKDA